MRSNRRRVVLFVVAGLVAGLVQAATSPPSVQAIPVADDPASYERCGRVFPDPHAYWPAPEPLPTQSPWAKGNAACRAVDFLGWDETISGLRFLESMAPDYLEVVDLSDPQGPFAGILDPASGEGMSSGLPTEGLGREKAPMYLVRVTDERSTEVPIDDRERFAFALSIHGIERAGIEGGIRAIEDLVTWAACEDDPAALTTCGLNGAIPHPLMETIPDESITAGDALERSSVWFVLSNPDGWRRGDKQRGGFFYQRYNGNGMDMNRDWPSLGYTFRPYTPFSEAETRAVGKVLKDIGETWTGGIDLHGQQIDRAFSFTLLGGSQRPFDKDRRVLQFTKGAFADAETRLSWSPIIKPNDAPPSCVEPGVPPTVNPVEGCDPTPHVYGVQWGTIWDTIAYTTTGALSDWMDSPVGLDADGIGNEMSLSHISNCGVGTCFLGDFEQLHVDGNKSLIYAMIHYSLLPEDTAFRHQGRAAWLDHDVRVSDPGSTGSTGATDTMGPQAGFTVDLLADPLQPATHEFEVLGPSQGAGNGAISVTFTSPNLRGVGNGTMVAAIDRYRLGEDDPNAPEPGWSEQNAYFNQSPVYLQSGARVDVNSPIPGRYRLRVEGAAGPVRATVSFLPEGAWPDPGQRPYDVSNLDFFDALAPFATSLGPVSLAGLLDGSADLSAVDSLVVADDAFLPGYRPDAAAPRTTPQAPITATVAMGAPGAGVRTTQTSAFHEFNVEAGHASLDAVLESPTVADADLYLQRRNPDGTWSADVADGTSAAVNRETLTYADPPAGRYRIEAHDYAGSPGDAELTVSFTVPPAPPADQPAAAYTPDDEKRLLDALRSFVEGGGNLVLTDDALRVVERLGLVPDGSVTRQNVYAGYVEFSTDGGATATYDDPLAADIQQPGAAEGPGHRHQMSEPVPLGFAIQDEDGADAESMPQWLIDRAAWEDAGGRTVGMVDGKVTFGELPVGDGRIRVLGSLLPVPTEAYDHPFGLSSYAVTYAGYEAFRNMLDSATPAPAADTSGGTDQGPAGGPSLTAAVLTVVRALTGLRSW